MPQSSDKDAARYGYATRVVHDNPQAGFEWASAIEDPESRNSAMIHTGKVFMQKDPESAKETIAGLDLPEEVVQQITDGK